MIQSNRATSSLPKGNKNYPKQWPSIYPTYPAVIIFFDLKKENNNEHKILSMEGSTQ
jgi:hypothetical protein